jgi:hypothetical protein
MKRARSLDGLPSTLFGIAQATTIGEQRVLTRINGIQAKLVGAPSDRVWQWWTKREYNDKMQ